MRRALSLDRSPSLDVPLRFFVNVPLFALLAAGVLLWAGPDAFASRWSRASLALTHLFTLGILTSAMTGALIQILPVATGVHIAHPRMSATAIHALLTAGTLTLVSAFLFGVRMLYAVASLLLAGAVLGLLAACAIGFWRYRRKTATGSADVLCAVRLSLIALLVTAVLGAVLAGSPLWPTSFAPTALTQVHVMWGLAGWVGLLTIGMAYQLIPMFQVTELYPQRVTRTLAPLILSLLVLVSASAAAFPKAETPLVMVLVCAYVAFAAITLHLLWTRKRAQADATTLFWRTAMTSLACCGPLSVVQIERGDPACAVTLGVVCLFGVAWSSVNGMLYKIVPFLLWYHAQRPLTGAAMRLAPKVKDMISDRAASAQFYAHLIALLLLVAASRWHAFTRVGALAAGVSAGWLGINMARALRRYLRVRRDAASIAADEP